MHSGCRGGWVGWAVISLIIGLSISVGARDLRVPDEFRTIEDAVRAATFGDTVVVQDQFVIRDSISLRNVRRLTIKGEFRFRRNTVIQGLRETEPVFELMNCRELTFKNLTIQGGSVGISAENCRDIEIVECLVQENVEAGLSGSGFVLEETTVTSNGTWGIELIGDPYAPTDAVIELIDSFVTANIAGGMKIKDAYVYL